MRFALILLLVSCQAMAQIDVGIRAGLNVSDIKEKGVAFSNDDFFNPKVSYHLGVFSKIPTTERVFILTEAVYSRKGSRLRDFTGNRSNLNFSYLSVPILAGLQFNDWSVVFGPQLSFGVDSDVLDTNTEFSLVLGGKYYLDDRTQLGLRYVQGLTALNRITFVDSSGGAQGVGRLTNQLIQISLSYDLYSFE